MLHLSPNTFSLFVFPTKAKAITYFRSLATDAAVIKRTDLNIQSDDFRLMAVVPRQIICGLNWKGNRPNMLVVSEGVDTGSDWYNRTLLPAMCDDFELIRIPL